MVIKGLEHVKQDRSALQLALMGREQSELIQSQLTATLLDAISGTYNQVVDCAENGNPFVPTCYGNSPEKLAALDLASVSLIAVALSANSTAICHGRN